MVIRRTQARQLKEIIDDFLKEIGIDKKLKERTLISQWEEVVGRNIARSTTDIQIRDRKLYLTVRSAVVRNELIMIREGILQELNRRAGEKILDEMIVR
jgi:predicted nucleic acid-binding Zn ribbon protein